MKLALSGATGLVGSRFFDLLKTRYEIIPISSSAGVDITDKKDLEEVFKTAKEFGKAIEVNSHYLRLDLKDINIRKAIDMDTKLVITTDSHHPNQLTLMRLGVATARRGWAVKRDIINTMGFKELSNFLKIQTD